MNRKRRRRNKTTWLADTTLAIYLSLNIETIDDRGKRLATLPLIPLTWLLGWGWRLGSLWSNLKRPKRSARLAANRPRSDRRPPAALVLTWIFGRSLLWGLAGV